MFKNGLELENLSSWQSYDNATSMRVHTMVYKLLYENIIHQLFTFGVGYTNFIWLYLMLSVFVHKLETYLAL